MIGVTEIQIAGLTADGLRKAIRAAATAEESVLVMDGTEPLVRLFSVRSEMKARGDFFLHYPHDPMECFGSCWRHNGEAQPDPDSVPEAEPEPVG